MRPIEYSKALLAAMAYTGHTQEELARKIGISVDTLGRRLKHPERFTVRELEAADQVVKWRKFTQEVR